MELNELLKLIRAVSDSDWQVLNMKQRVCVWTWRRKRSSDSGTDIAGGRCQPVSDADAGRLQHQHVRSSADSEEKAAGTKEAEQKGFLVKSPLVGTFYAAPAGDAAPYVAVGDTVKKGQTVAIVEAMKLMNDIESDFDGTVLKFLWKTARW